MLPLKINAGIKNKFLQFGLKVKKVSKFSKESYETPGHVWDALLSKWIRQYYPVDCESSKVEKGPATLLILDVELLHDLTFLDSKFPLFGFMREVAKDQKKHPELYLWQGEADAIAYSCALKKYVIVDFKVVDNLSDYCKSKTDLCGKHLHQCLVYSKLLQLHMKLDYLPPSLIVVIHKATGKEGYFPLFKDYPQECKDRLNEYEWFTEQPSKRPLKIANTNKLLKQKYRSQELYFLPDARLRDIFAMNATAKDLLDSLGYDSLEIFRQEQ